MIRKEFGDIFQSTLVRLSFLGIIPLSALLKVSPWKIYHFFMVSMFRILNGYAEHIYLNSFTFLLAVIILWTANHYGTHAFRGEHRDRAFEYLLSFPFSKFRILVYKFVPRVSLLLLLTILYEVGFSVCCAAAAGTGAVILFHRPCFFSCLGVVFPGGGIFPGVVRAEELDSGSDFPHFFLNDTYFPGVVQTNSSSH
jgi:ABC-type transport system involved in multi-copper enzyme maturation permease subunit